MKKPIQNRVRADSIRKVIETILGEENFSIFAIIFVCAIFIILGWLPEGVSILLENHSLEYKFYVPIIFLFIIWIYLEDHISKYEKIKVIRKTPRIVKALGIFLSPTRVKDIEQNIINKTLILDDFIKIKDSWEITFLSITYHLSEVEYLYVITSNETHNIFKLFENTVKYFFPTLKDKIKIIELVEKNEEGEIKGVDFENIGKLFDITEEFYDSVTKQGISEEDSIIDITGGQKPASIAGAISTLVVGRKFQYISTITKKVYSYDVVVNN